MNARKSYKIAAIVQVDTRLKRGVLSHGREVPLDCGDIRHSQAVN